MEIKLKLNLYFVEKLKKYFILMIYSFFYFKANFTKFSGIFCRFKYLIRYEVKPFFLKYKTLPISNILLICQPNNLFSSLVNPNDKSKAALSNSALSNFYEVPHFY